MVEVVLCPELKEDGLGTEAEIERSVPIVFSRTLILLSPEFATTMSGDLLPSRSTLAIPLGLDPTAKVTPAWKVPSPLP